MKHLLQVLAVVALFLTGYTAKAQMSYGGEPYSFKNTISQVVHPIEYEALDAEKLLAEDAAIPGKDHIMRIGVGQVVNYTMENSGRMDMLPDGGRVWRIAFHMKEATFTSMHFSTFNIPDGAELFLYTPDREYVIGKFTNKNQMEDGTFYPQQMPGEEIVVEYYEPAGCAFKGELVIDQLSQGYYDFFHIKSEQPGHADGNCHPNAVCSLANWRAQISSVVCYVMSWQVGYYIYSGMCTGAMINCTANNNNTNKKYVLSANHCYPTEASGTVTWTFYFNYQTTSCSGTSGNWNQTATGCTVRARAETTEDNIYTSSDFMLMEISGGINPAFDVYFSGWSLSTSTPTVPGSCAAIHHPGGDFKKFSTPNNIYDGSQFSGGDYSKYWAVNWTAAKGTTEQGSSGSPLFNKDKLIVGQLQGGSSSCSYPQGYDIYGKISNSWTNNNNSNNAKKLKPWLDPNGSATSLQGRWMNGSPSSIKFNEASNLNVFPNPSNGIVTISGSFNMGDGLCNVYDLVGNLVMSKKINLNDETTLNLFSLTPGMYLIEIFDNNDIYRSKILISK